MRHACIVRTGDLSDRTRSDEYKCADPASALREKKFVIASRRRKMRLFLSSSPARFRIFSQPIVVPPVCRFGDAIFDNVESIGSLGAITRLGGRGVSVSRWNVPKRFVPSGARENIPATLAALVPGAYP